MEEIGDTKRNCDQATNDMSSQGNTTQQAESQEHQQQQQQHASSTNNTTLDSSKTGDDDEDEDRQTNHLYSTYSSFNSTHNHHENDDDDDCNSSEDTKTSCRNKCDSIKTEQHNGQQQQVLDICNRKHIYAVYRKQKVPELYIYCWQVNNDTTML